MLNILLIISVKSSLFSQSIAPISHPKVQFSMGLLNGIGQSKFTPLIGDIQNFKYINSTNILMFRSSYWFSKKFYAEIGWGFGVNIENPRAPIFENDLWNLFSYHVFPQARIEFSSAYELAQIKNNSLYLKIGSGWNRFLSQSSSSSASADNFWLSSEYTVESKRLPFLSVGLEYAVSTKRLDELKFYVGYQYASRSFYDGSFSFQDATPSTYSSGSLSSNLSAIQLGLSYSFTRVKKMQQINILQEQQSLKSKEARKKNRFNRREIDPKSKWITLGSGFGVNHNKFRPKNDPFIPMNFGSFLWRGAFEMGYRNNLFFEGDYYGFSFWQGQGFRLEGGGSSGSRSLLFASHFLSAGAQYKIQNKTTNFQFFNIHAGIGLGAHFSPNGMESWGSYSDGQNIQYTYTSKIKNRFMPIIYGGISKDFRVTERLALNVNYKHQLGFVKIVETDYLFQDNTLSEPKSVLSKIDGSAFFVQFGLKYQLR